MCLICIDKSQINKNSLLYFNKNKTRSCLMFYFNTEYKHVKNYDQISKIM